jgi:chromosome segregation ATPase
LEIDQITREKESIEKLLVEKDAEIKLTDVKKSESEQHGTSLQEEISQKRLNLEEYRTEVTDIRLSITSLKERAESVGKERESISREIAEGDQKKEFLSEEISSVQSRILQRETEFKADEERIKALVSIADEYRKEISGRKEVIDSENQELLVTEQGLKVLRNQIDLISQRVAELDIQKAEHRLKMEGLYENIRQNYGLALDVVEVEPLTEEDEKRSLS